MAPGRFQVGDFDGSVDEGEELAKRDKPVAFKVRKGI
jgi:hypothetical protein